jgi:hypothetical protein
MTNIVVLAMVLDRQLRLHRRSERCRSGRGKGDLSLDLRAI